MVISEVFRDPVSAAPPTGPVMLLEGLQAGIAGQLAVLDDAGLTGTGQSSADVLGVPGTVLADRLTGHLVREIIVRGSGGGPLTPLADQLNHERTRLQGQRIEGMLARLAAEVRDALPRPDSGVTVAGWPLEEVTDPFALEVHRPVQPEDAPPGLPVLPPYVPREHDQVLGQVVRAAAEGRSGIAVLVGGSSTGKTRACWEALELLRDQDPSVAAVAPDRPVPPGRGAAGAAGHRAADRGVAERGPVLPRPGRRRAGRAGRRRAAGAAARPRPGPGARAGHAVARVLGHPDCPPGRRVTTRMPRRGSCWPGTTSPCPPRSPPRRWTSSAGRRMRGWTLAARSARDGAGDPVPGRGAGAAGPVPQRPARRGGADRRGDGCPPPGHGRGPAAGVPGSRRTGVPDRRPVGRPRRGLAGTGPGLHRRPVQGGPRAADPHPPPPGPAGPPAIRGDQPAARTAAAGPLYRLADYLDQHGRAHRASQIPPAEFWSAAAAHAAPGDQAALGGAADARGLYRDAAQLHKNAAAVRQPPRRLLPQRSSSLPAR